MTTIRERDAEPLRVMLTLDAVLAALQQSADDTHTLLAALDRMVEAAQSTLVELDIVRAHNPDGGRYIVHIDTQADLRIAIESARKVTDEAAP